MHISGMAVLGIALISMGEDVGAEMSFRTFGHLVWISLNTDIYLLF